MLYDRTSVITNPELEIHEKQLNELFRKDASLVIFDIGACEGESSMRYSRQFSNANVYTFEPVPGNFKLVEKNVAQFAATNVHPFQLCLSNKTGTAEFYVSSGRPDEFKDKELDWEFGNKSSSLLAPDKTLEAYDWIEFKDKISVPTIRLDNFTTEHKISHIDFIHMDVQGAELMVMEGAGDFLKNIRSLWLEVEEISLYKNQPLRKDVENFFKQRGFIKILETKLNVFGDQFWCERNWLVELKGEKWIVDRTAELKARAKQNRKHFFNNIRDRVQLRTRLKKLLGR